MPYSDMFFRRISLFWRTFREGLYEYLCVNRQTDILNITIDRYGQGVAKYEKL